MSASLISVIKRNLHYEETWRYTGHIIRTGKDAVLIEALFNRSDLPFHGITLRQNDRFVEIYFGNRWYNIFEIHDVDDDRLKAWYCNITRPAEIDLAGAQISYVDLALDLLVFPDGRQLVLDEDEFAALCLTPDLQQQARSALVELKLLFKDINSFLIETLLG